VEKRKENGKSPSWDMPLFFSRRAIGCDAGARYAFPGMQSAPLTQLLPPTTLNSPSIVVLEGNMSYQQPRCAVPVGKVYATLSQAEDMASGFASNIVPMGRQFCALALNNQVGEIVNPAANENGLVIRTCSFSQMSNTAAGAQLYADVEPPASFGDGSKRLVFLAVAPPPVQLPYQLYVPPGHGLWFATNAPASINLSYDFLENSAGQ